MSRFLRLTSSLSLATAPLRSVIFCLLIAMVALSPAASAQDFTLTMGTFDPFAIDPNGLASSNITLVAGTGFTATVTLGCQVTTSQTGVTPPQCLISPGTVQPSGSATATILSEYTQNGQTVNASPGTYTVIVTGTGGSKTHQGAQAITVLAVNPQFTITVQSPVLPNTVTPPNGGIGTVSINPVFGYQGNITLSCASVTPLVTIPPQCQFTYPSSCPAGVTGVACVTSGPLAVQVSIITFGPEPNTAVQHPRVFYAFWLPFPMLGLAILGMATGRKRSRKVWGLFTLFVLCASLMLLPACGDNLIPSKSTPNGLTPKGNYTFTLEGVDQKGNISSNTGTANQAPTITLSVN
jgi:hypothetical protein